MSIREFLFGARDVEDGTAPRGDGPLLISNDADGFPPTQNYQDWKEIFGAGLLPNAGVPVNEKTAMRVSAVYSSVGLIAGAISGMPIAIYQRTDEGRKKVEDHDLWWILNEEPNPIYSAAVFWEYFVSSMLLHGDGFAKIIRKNRLSPNIKGLEALHPLCVDVRKNDGRLIYTIYRTEGMTQVLDQDDVLHVPNLGFNGLRGMSNLRNALATSAGVALAADNYSADFFRNGARPDFVLTNKKNTTPEQAEIIRQTWAARHSGAGRHHLPAILTGEMEVKQLTMSSEDSQLLATRQYQIEDIARIFGVPPFMIGRSEKNSSWGSGVEQMGLGFVKYTLMKHLIKIQQELNRKCFRTATNFVEFTTAALERGDIKSRYEAHRIAIGRAGEPGFLTVDEVRRIENLPPVEGGNKLNPGATSNAPASDPKTA